MGCTQTGDDEAAKKRAKQLRQQQQATLKAPKKEDQKTIQKSALQKADNSTNPGSLPIQRADKDNDIPMALDIQSNIQFRGKGKKNKKDVNQ